MSGNPNVPSTWAPPNESSFDLWTERSNFVSVPLSSVAYGIHLTLYLIVSHHLIAHPSSSSSSSRRNKPSWPLIIYISVNFILGTFGIAAESRFNELTFVDDRNYPGGPNAFVNAQYGDFINIFGTASYVVLNWLADSLVIYRFWLIYSFNYWVVIIPTALLLASVSMGIILLFQLTQPSANLWTHTTVNFGLPYFSISISLNILVTTLIVLRLLYIRQQTRRALTSAHAKTYTSIMAMLVESAALYSITALIFIGTYARGNNVQNLVLPVLGQVQAISPLLIMWRVALGQAWTRDTWSVTTSKGANGGMHTGSKISWNRNAFLSRRTNGTNNTNTNGTGLTDGEFTSSSSTSNVNGIPVPSLPMSARQRFHHHNHQSHKLAFLDEKGAGVGGVGNELDEDIDIDLDDRVSGGHGRWVDVNVITDDIDHNLDRLGVHDRDLDRRNVSPNNTLANVNANANTNTTLTTTTMTEKEKDQLSTTSGISSSSGISGASGSTIDIEKDAEVMALEWVNSRSRNRNQGRGEFDRSTRIPIPMSRSRLGGEYEYEDVDGEIVGARAV